MRWETSSQDRRSRTSRDDFRILRTNLLEGGSASRRDRLVPYTVFIDPQLGRVGLNEIEARATGHRIRVAQMPMSYVARAQEMDETRGFMKALVDADTGQILGAAVLGVEGGELMAAIQVAMMGKLPYSALRDGVFAHPTLDGSDCGPAWRRARRPQLPPAAARPLGKPPVINASPEVVLAHV